MSSGSPLHPLLLAFQFLTRLPMPPGPLPEAAQLGRSLLLYPLVGGAIGLLLLVAAWLMGPLPPLLTAALLLLLWVGLTGALHLDGLADSADAWIGGQGDRERTLAIMKDPRSGPMGVVALVLLLQLKFAALTLLLEQGGSLFWLLLPPVLGRTVLLPLFLTTRYVRAGGLGEAMVNHLPRRAALAVLMITLLAVAPMEGGVAAIAAAAIAFIGARWLLCRRLGGTTGDTAGALVEVVEVLILVSLVGVLSIT